MRTHQEGHAFTRNSSENIRPYSSTRLTEPLYAFFSSFFFLVEISLPIPIPYQEKAKADYELSNLSPNLRMRGKKHHHYHHHHHHHMAFCSSPASFNLLPTFRSLLTHAVLVSEVLAGAEECMVGGSLV